MTQDSTDPETYTITLAEKVAGKPKSLEAFLTTKLGHTAGKRFHKELVATVKEATAGLAGSPVILLSSSGGTFAAVTEN